MPDLRDFCDRLWQGEIDTIHEAHPVTSTWNNREPEEVADGFLYIKSAASMNTIDTGDGLVMLDTGTARDAEGLYSAVRGWRPDTPLRAAVFSHHHVDHIFGVNKFDEEAAEKGQSRPVVYGQRHIPAHFRSLQADGRLQHGDQLSAVHPPRHGRDAGSPALA